MAREKLPYGNALRTQRNDLVNRCGINSGKKKERSVSERGMRKGLEAGELLEL